MSAHDAACTEAYPAAVAVGVVPVGEGHTGRCLVDVLPDEVRDAKEVVVVAGQGCRPHLPVALGVAGAAVEGQAVGAELAEVEVILLRLDLVGEEACRPGFVPHHVVLLAPGAGAVVGKLVVCAVLGELHPLRCHVLCLGDVGVVGFRVAPHLTETCIACHAHDGLDREVGIVCQMACEVVGAELVLGVCSVLHEVVRPCGERLPVAVGPLGVAVHDGDGSGQDDDVGTLLNGHVASEAAVSIGEAYGVDLVVGMGVGAEVVGCEVEAPAVALAIVEDRGAHALHELGVVEEEERCGGIGQVDGVDASVGVVLLREEEQVALLVLEYLVRCDAMAIGGAEDFCVLVVAGGEAVVVDNLVLHLAAVHDFVVAVLELGEGLLDGLAVTCPVAFVVDVHVAHVVDFVVAEHHVAAGLADLAKVVHEGELRHLALVGAGVGSGALGELACGGKGGGGELLVGHGDGAVHVGQVEVAPVDGDEVAGLAQHLLFLAAALDVSALAVADDGGRGGLTVVVDGELGRRAEVELHVVLLFVGRTDLIGDEVDGCGHEVDIVHEEGCGEDEVEVDAAAPEGVVGAGGQDVACGLYGQLLGCGVGVEADVGQGAARRVVDVIGYDVPACVEHVLVCFGEPVFDVLHPGVARIDDAAAVDVDLADIVVRVDEDEVLRQVLFGEGDVAADVVVAALGRPGGIDIRIFAGCAEGSLLCLPGLVVEVLAGPYRAALGGGLHPGLPSALVGHACDGFTPGVEAERVLVEAEVGLCSAAGVVHVEGYDVVTLDEGGTCGARDVHPDVLVPLFLRGDDLHAVDVCLADVVVRIDEPEVVPQVVCRQCDVAADVAVGVASRPVGPDVGILGRRSPGASLRGPSAFVQVGVHPCALQSGGHRGAHLGCVAALVAHRGNGQELCGTLRAHEAVHLAVHAEEAVHCLLLVVPVLGGAVVEVVVGRPEGEVGVVDQQGDAGQTEGDLLVRFEEIRRLGLHECGSEEGYRHE